MDGVAGKERECGARTSGGKWELLDPVIFECFGQGGGDKAKQCSHDTAMQTRLRSAIVTPLSDLGGTPIERW